MFDTCFNLLGAKLFCGYLQKIARANHISFGNSSASLPALKQSAAMQSFIILCNVLIFLGRPRRRWEDNIRMDLKKIGINTKNLVDSALDRDYWRTLVNMTLNLRVSYSIELVKTYEKRTYSK